MAEMAVFGVYFEHLYTCVNGMGKRDIKIRNWSFSNPASSLTSALSKSGPMTPAMSRNPQSTDSFLFLD